MGNVIEVDFDDKKGFRNEMNSIIDEFVVCLKTHYGDDAGHLMASAFSVCLEEIATRVTKELELKQAEAEPDILFTPENDMDILFTPDFNLGAHGRNN